MPAMRPPPPTGTNTAVRCAILPQDLHADRALTGDDERIVERMDEDAAGLAREFVAPCLRVGVAVAGEHDLGAHAAHRLHLDLRRRLAA